MFKKPDSVGPEPCSPPSLYRGVTYVLQECFHFQRFLEDPPGSCLEPRDLSRSQKGGENGEIKETPTG